MKKVILAAIVILLLAAGCSNGTQSTAIKPAPVAIDPQKAPEATSTVPSEPLQHIQATPNSVSQTVAGVSSKQNILKDETALDLLRATHKITTKDYSGIGEFVLSVDGVVADSKHFWEFFVNGKSSNVGASSYMLKAGDSIEWKLSEIK